MGEPANSTAKPWWRDQDQLNYLALFGEDEIWLDSGTDLRATLQSDPARTNTARSSSSPREPDKPTPNIPTPSESKGTAMSTSRKPKASAVSDTPKSSGAAPEVEGEKLRAIREELGDCKACPLCEQRTLIVFGEGDPDARIMFVGEGPGADEDKSGRPFVGRAGRLLTDIIEKGMNIAREEVFIANIVKCRPPGNRDPHPDEVAVCLPWLEKQIAAIKPEVLIVLGKPANRALLGHEGPMGPIRGKWQDYKGTPVMPTWHPSYLMRSPGHKKDTWTDIQLVMQRLGMK